MRLDINAFGCRGIIIRTLPKQSSVSYADAVSASAAGSRDLSRKATLLYVP